ncbi:methyltransferase [Candidatus Bathyarchaeota archaeon]|nr:methyltransferase [Candidatus Bathyarchaeota archaeon]
MQKRLARKLDLELLLSKTAPHPTPSPSLEQYTIPAETAAMMLYIAAYSNQNIVGKKVLDLGCGTGRLAIGAALLGAREVVGVDIDRTAVKIAAVNAAKLGAEKVQWVVTDIDAIAGQFDTVLQNPPFGVQKRGVDQRFLEKALQVGTVVYSLHKSICRDSKIFEALKKHKNEAIPAQPSPFLEAFIEAHGGRIWAVYKMAMSIPHMFAFHTKKKHVFLVDLYVIHK